ncbi:MAG: zinc ribbon domain-containing protein [Planctomycetia bacterium]
MTQTLTVPDILERIQALARHDDDVRALDEQLERDPKAVAAQAAEVAQLDAQLKKLDELLRAARVRVRMLETERKAGESRKAKLAEQSNTVRNQKEYMAYRAEIANAQADIDRLETEEIKVLDMLKQGEARQQATQAQRAAAQQRLDEGRAATAARLADVKARRDGLAAQRPARLEGLAPTTLQVYEAARRARGQGTALLEGDACSACHTSQVRNDVLAVTNKTRVVACKACNRILLPR